MAGVLFRVACVVVASVVSGGAAAQTAPAAPPGILIVDREKALGESELAQALAELERRERLALRGELDQFQKMLETEEAEITKLRENSSSDEFKARVKAFDQRVREARRTFQEKGEALQARHAGARRRLAQSLGPILAALLAETGASLIVDARQVLAARPGADVSDEVIRRLDASSPPLEALLPPPGDGG